MSKKPLMPNQAIILWHMAHGPHADEGPFATSGDDSRLHGFGIWRHKQGGIVFRVYSAPFHFLAGRGLVERVQRNVAGAWYRLTEEGRIAAPQVQPKTPQPNSYSTFGKR